MPRDLHGQRSLRSPDVTDTLSAAPLACRSRCGLGWFVYVLIAAAVVAVFGTAAA